MATVYKRNGVGKYQIDWFDHTGKRRSKSSGTTDKAAANRIAAKLDADAALRRERVIDTDMGICSPEAKLQLSSGFEARSHSRWNFAKQAQPTYSNFDSSQDSRRSELLRIRAMKQQHRKRLRSTKCIRKSWAKPKNPLGLSPMPPQGLEPWTR